MRSLEETQSRWQATQESTASLGDLQRAVKGNGSSSPCLSGCRSVCWKLFLLPGERSLAGCKEALEAGRKEYRERRDHFLKFIEHPEALNELTIDPLADDPESPWNTVRQDELIRTEIKQDVQRLPDEVNYHEDRIQEMILDILFIYCKVNPNRGGYRQGMHELLAPLVFTIEQDALDRAALDEKSKLDQTMLDMLDSSFIEHDAYILFSRLMESAQSFYEVTDGSNSAKADVPSAAQEQRSAIVERSKFIHDVCLQRVDPQLARHLKNIEILPQIFLIRWIRLLFSREFPFNQFLVLWDTIFAIDPSLDLIDLICVAMLIRIRWELLEADYPVCLQLLLKYPAPDGTHGPHTFVDDAVYLRDHLNPAGGSELIKKYTGKIPHDADEHESAQHGTSTTRGINSLRQKEARGTVSSPSRFMQQQGGMETLFQGAAKGAKGVLERGEKLGINQVVRDAMGEIRKNMQSFNEARQTQRSPRHILSDEGAAKALTAMERRNKQLASLLNETVKNLKTVTMSEFDDSTKAKSLELIEVAAAKIQFVQIYLEDPTMEVPAVGETGEVAEVTKAKPSSEKEPKQEEKKPKPPAKDKKLADEPPRKSREGQPRPDVTAPIDSKGSTVAEDDVPTPAKQAPAGPAEPVKADEANTETSSDPLGNQKEVESRPAPVPTRSTLAQSSFSWMLEPDESAPSRPSPAASKSPPAQNKKRMSNNMSRERNAFLFGEDAAESEGPTVPPKADDIFGMEPISKAKGKSSGGMFG